MSGYDEALRLMEEARQEGSSTLRLSDLDLETCPPEIGDLTSLTRLDLRINYLSTLPPEIRNLPGLIVHIVRINFAIG